MRLKVYFRAIVLASSFCILTSCAAWRSGQQDTSAIIDGNANYASTVQPSGLGDDTGGPTTASATDEQALSKRTYYFDFDKSTLREEDRPAVEANAQYLVNHP